MFKLNVNYLPIAQSKNQNTFIHLQFYTYEILRERESNGTFFIFPYRTWPRLVQIVHRLSKELAIYKEADDTVFDRLTDGLREVGPLVRTNASYVKITTQKFWNQFSLIIG